MRVYLALVFALLAALLVLVSASFDGVNNVHWNGQGNLVIRKENGENRAYVDGKPVPIASIQKKPDPTPALINADIAGQIRKQNEAILKQQTERRMRDQEARMRRRI